jgi:hypothetical protein
VDVVRKLAAGEQAQRQRALQLELPTVRGPEISVLYIEMDGKLYPADSKQREVWACRLQRKLDAGQIESLVVELGKFLTSNRKVEEQIRIEAEYFSHDAHHMRYPMFRKQHLFIGYGVIEAGCKTIIGSRLKQSGMFRMISTTMSRTPLRRVS